MYVIKGCVHNDKTHPLRLLLEGRCGFEAFADIKHERKFYRIILKYV